MMPLFYEYWFAHRVKKLVPVDDVLTAVIEDVEVVFYANREDDARLQFLETYGYEPGVLLRREGW